MTAYRHLSCVALAAMLVANARQAAVQQRAAGTRSGCVAKPDLFADWARATVGANYTRQQLLNYLATQRARVARLGDPFDRIAAADSASRTAMQERVVWEDSTLMILVDRFHGSPKLLVIPKPEMMFLSDASDALQQHLAIAAQAAADALIKTARQDCATARANIYVNPPTAISLRHLHVHVEPLDPIQAGSGTAVDEFYRRVHQQLRGSLW